jgi:hypothetical protein
MRAAHDVRVRLPRLVDVVGVGTAAAQELGIFSALDALADAVIRIQGRNSMEARAAPWLFRRPACSSFARTACATGAAQAGCLRSHWQ